MLLTYGDSLHSLLTDAEVVEVLKVVIDTRTSARWLLPRTAQWWTGKEIEFADFALEAGADMLMVLPPNWAGGPPMIRTSRTTARSRSTSR